MHRKMSFYFVSVLLGIASLQAEENEFSKYKNGITSGDQVVTTATEGSAKRNSEFIYSVLLKYIIGSMHVFEIGTGRADQAIFFGEQFTQAVWQTSDVENYHGIIKEKLRVANLPDNRVKDPIIFDIDNDEIQGSYDLVYASNVLHCIPWESANRLFKKSATALKPSGMIILYGPFNIKDLANIDGVYTSIGNKNFDAKLKSQDNRLGLREIGEVIGLANEHGFIFEARHDHVSANNYILIFKKITPTCNLD